MAKVQFKNCLKCHKGIFNNICSDTHFATPHMTYYYTLRQTWFNFVVSAIFDFNNRSNNSYLINHTFITVYFRWLTDTTGWFILCRSLSEAARTLVDTGVTTGGVYAALVRQTGSRLLQTLINIYQQHVIDVWNIYYWRWYNMLWGFHEGSFRAVALTLSRRRAWQG